MKLIKCLAAAVGAAIMVEAAVAEEAGRWFGSTDESGAYAYMVTNAEPDGESVHFNAACAPGAPVELSYLTERERMPGQQDGENGMREPVEKLAIKLLVDGQNFAYALARAQPEEMYGGNEVSWSTGIEDPLFAALKSGQRLSLEIDGKAGDPLSLKGSAGPIARLLAACRK